MKRPYYHDPARATINLAFSRHSVADEKADLNLKIVNGHINKRMKSCHPAKPWGVGYPTYNLEGYVPYPESLILPSKPSPKNVLQIPTNRPPLKLSHRLKLRCGLRLQLSLLGQLQPTSLNLQFRGARRVPSEALVDEDRLSDFP